MEIEVTLKHPGSLFDGWECFIKEADLPLLTGNVTVFPPTYKKDIAARIGLIPVTLQGAWCSELSYETNDFGDTRITNVVLCVDRIGKRNPQRNNREVTK